MSINTQAVSIADFKAAAKAFRGHHAIKDKRLTNTDANNLFCSIFNLNPYRQEIAKAQGSNIILTSPTRSKLADIGIAGEDYDIMLTIVFFTLYRYTEAVGIAYKEADEYNCPSALVDGVEYQGDAVVFKPWMIEFPDIQEQIVRRTCIDRLEEHLRTLSLDELKNGAYSTMFMLGICPTPSNQAEFLAAQAIFNSNGAAEEFGLHGTTDDEKKDSLIRFLHLYEVKTVSPADLSTLLSVSPAAITALDHCSFEHKVCRIKKDGPGYEQLILTDEQIISLAQNTDRFTAIIHKNNIDTELLIYEFADGLTVNELINHMKNGGKILELYVNNQQVLCPYSERTLVEHAQRYLETFGHQFYSIQDGLRIIALEGEESGFFSQNTVWHLLEQYENSFKPMKLENVSGWY